MGRGSLEERGGVWGRRNRGSDTLPEARCSRKAKGGDFVKKEDYRQRGVDLGLEEAEVLALVDTGAARRKSQLEIKKGLCQDRLGALLVNQIR